MKSYIHTIHGPNIYFEWAFFFDGIFHFVDAVERLEPQVNVISQCERKFSSPNVGLIAGRMLPIYRQAVKRQGKQESMIYMRQRANGPVHQNARITISIRHPLKQIRVWKKLSCHKQNLPLRLKEMLKSLLARYTYEIEVIRPFIKCKEILNSWPSQKTSWFRSYVLPTTL